MTQQEIQERNEQIALMLGAIDYKADKWYKLGGYKEHIYFPNWNYPNRFLEKDLKFHSDWNWLMEAVEFIEEKLKLKTVISNMGFGINNQYININRDVSIIDETIDNPSKIMGKSSNKKEAIFLAVSDFAKLYNNKEL